MMKIHVLAIIKVEVNCTCDFSLKWGNIKSCQLNIQLLRLIHENKSTIKILFHNSIVYLIWVLSADVWFMNDVDANWYFTGNCVFLAEKCRTSSKNCFRFCFVNLWVLQTTTSNKNPKDDLLAIQCNRTWIGNIHETIDGSTLW